MAWLSRFGAALGQSHSQGDGHFADTRRQRNPWWGNETVDAPTPSRGLRRYYPSTPVLEFVADRAAIPAANTAAMNVAGAARSIETPIAKPVPATAVSDHSRLADDAHPPPVERA
jgi:hypothetical protein